MCELINQLVCLLGENEFCVSIFENIKDVEYFQLKLGLGDLCQNTLIYQFVDESGQKVYKTSTSPHAEQFYSDDCRLFRAADKSCNATLCNDLQGAIARYFFEPNCTTLPDDMDYKILEYPNWVTWNRGKNGKLQNQYIRYRCPYVSCFKYGFPIYINEQAIAILFVGQFFMGENSDEKQEPIPRNNWFFSPRYNIENLDSMHHQSPFTENRSFPNEEGIDEYVQTNIFPIIKEFISTAQQNYVKKQIKILRESVTAACTNLEKSFLPLVNQFSSSVMQEDYQITVLERFWEIVRKNLSGYLEKIEVESLYLFMASPTETQLSHGTLDGIMLYNVAAQRSRVCFLFTSAQRAMTNASVAYSTNVNGDKSNFYLFDYVQSDRPFDLLRGELLVHTSALPAFAIVYEFYDKSKTAANPFLRYHILTELEQYFLKVGQLLTYLSIKLSEYNTISILRIFRHEITHQISALNQDLWELDPSRFKSLDENKLDRIISDHRQCLVELDFMTQNIDVITGRVKSKVLDYVQDRKIDVASQVFNRTIGLNQPIKTKKQLWFDIRYNSHQSYFIGCLELVDLIFFNLMSNATKYAYEGTKLLLGFGDSPYHGRPHVLSVTDFGCGIQTKEQEQLFQIYYREKNSVTTEGSGIGLYISKKVSELIGATLSWKCELVSEYHIPALARFLSLSKCTQSTSSSEFIMAEAEYNRLNREGQWNMILNNEYLSQPSQWIYDEIKGRLKTRTYKVTFELNL